MKEKNRINYSQSFSLALILSQLDINITENTSKLTQLSFSVFLFSLIALLCFFNVVGFLITYIFIEKKDYESKYPRLKRLINYYKKSSFIFIIIEGIICVSCLLLLIIFSLIFVLSGIK
jgi:hypothetical protein